MKPGPWKALTQLNEIHELGRKLAEKEPVVHNLIGSLLMGLKEPATVHIREGDVIEAALWNSINLVLTDLAYDGMLDLAHLLENSHLPGVVGPLEAAEGFVEAYAAVVGIRPKHWINQMLFRCDQLRERPGVLGAARSMRAEDEEWFVAAMKGFSDEALAHELPYDLEKLRAHFSTYVKEERFFLWELNGTPRAFAGLSGETPWSRRIGPVYTLPGERGHGYAGAITAHLTRIIQSAGKVPCLYTDLSVPDSNAAYKRIGYVEVRKSLHAVYPA